MNLLRSHHLARQRGLATVLVFVLLVLVGAYIVAATRSLSQLKAEIRLLEKKQLLSGPTAAGTNRPPAPPLNP